MIRRPTAAKILFAAALLACLTPLLSPALALAAGMALALTAGNPFPDLSRRWAKRLLQLCVILLGFSMNLHVVLHAGEEGALFAALTIALTFILAALFARLLHIERMVSTLIAAGTAICGGSAIAAVGSVTGAEESEMTVAMGTVFLLNALALYLFPLVGHTLHLTDAQFGTWAGVAIHDISSVVGASARYSTPALQTATAVKLSRALWIIPVALATAVAFRKRPAPGLADTTIGFDAAQTPAPSRGKLQIPWFIALFLLASLLRTGSPTIATLAPRIATLATAGLTLTLFLIGAGLSRATLRAVGPRPMVQGTLLWLAISTLSLAVILHWMH